MAATVPLRFNGAEPLENLAGASHRILSWLPVASGTLRDSLHWASHRTGLPIVVIGAALLVTLWRIVQRSLRLVAEVAIGVALLLVANRLGWIVW